MKNKFYFVMSLLLILVLVVSCGTSKEDTSELNKMFDEIIEMKNNELPSINNEVIEVVVIGMSIVDDVKLEFDKNQYYKGISYEIRQDEKGFKYTFKNVSKKTDIYVSKKHIGIKDVVLSGTMEMIMDNVVSPTEITLKYDIVYQYDNIPHSLVYENSTKNGITTIKVDGIKYNPKSTPNPTNQ